MTRILVVDDEDIVRRALLRLFRGDEFQVHEAENGKVAIPIWEEVNPDIIFLDVLMPEMSGIQVLDVVKGFNQGKIIMMSAYTGEYNLEKAKAMGADRFIPKPFQDILEIKKLVSELRGE